MEVTARLTITKDKTSSTCVIGGIILYTMDMSGADMVNFRAHQLAVMALLLQAITHAASGSTQSLQTSVDRTKARGC